MGMGPSGGLGGVEFKGVVMGPSGGLGGVE